MLSSPATLTLAAVTSVNQPPLITDAVAYMRKTRQTQPVWAHIWFPQQPELMWAKSSCGWRCCRHFQPKLGSFHISGSHPPHVGGLICLWPPWALKKREAKNRKREMYNAAQPSPGSLCGFLWSLFGQWSPLTRCLIFPPLRRNPIHEVSLYIFPVLLATNKSQEECGSDKLLSSTCLAEISSLRDIHDCWFLRLVSNKEGKPD